MDFGKQFDIQKQIRNNTNDFQNYARELNLWEAEMKRKDRELCEQSCKKNVPPLEKKSKNEASHSKNSKPSSISAFDYSAWDKFDVDKACEELDKDDLVKSEDSESDEEEDLDRMTNAVYNKEQGNKLVQQGKWGEAIEKYNLAIQIYPHDAVFYANRALCFLKMKNYLSAEADCSSSLRINDNYVKAYLRRASARQALRRFEEARNDLLKVVSLEPHNKQAEAELKEVNQKLNIPMGASDDAGKTATVNLDKSTNCSNAKNNTTSGSSKSSKPPDLSWVPPYDISQYSIVPQHHIPPHQRSKKPLTKLNIKPDDAFSNSIVTNLSEEKERNKQLIQNEETVPCCDEDKVDTQREIEERKEKFKLLESTWNELQNAIP